MFHVTWGKTGEINVLLFISVIPAIWTPGTISVFYFSDFLWNMLCTLKGRRIGDCQNEYLELLNFKFMLCRGYWVIPWSHRKNHFEDRTLNACACPAFSTFLKHKHNHIFRLSWKQFIASPCVLLKFIQNTHLR